MSELEAKAIEKALKVLENLGCQYFVVSKNGETFGEIPQKRKKRKANSFPLGTFTNYFKPILKDLQPGQMAIIPILDFPKESLASSLAAHMSVNWGSGSYTYETVGNEIHVLRLL